MGIKQLLKNMLLPETYNTYQEYLKTRHWQRTRTIKLAEVEHRCQVCNSPYSLNVHHRTYKDTGNENLNDLTVLCRECHSLFHEHSKLVKYTK